MLEHHGEELKVMLKRKLHDIEKERRRVKVRVLV